MPRKSLDQFHDDDEVADSVESADKDLEFGPGNREAIQCTCEAIGQIIESWGFKKIMGMIWAFLYLCPEPASAKDICSALGISPALASITLQDLQRWQVVKKITPIGKRRDYYVAEHDVWKMIRKVLREREKAGMEMVKSRLQEALEALHHEESRTLDLRSRRTSQFQKVRLEDLLSTTQTAMRLVDTLIDAGQLNVAPIFALLKPYQQLAKSVKSS